MNWDDYRNPDWSINLVKAFRAVYSRRSERAEGYLTMIETLQPINSRQAAAQAIATADELFQEQ